MLIKEIIEQQDIDYYAEGIKKDCNEYLSIIDSLEKLFIRGMRKGVYNEIGSKSVRKNRKPRDTHRIIDEAVELYRAENFPKVPSRKQSVFCFLNSKSNIEEVRNYGERNFIFIPDEANYWQSKTVEDFTGSAIYSYLLKIKYDFDKTHDANVQEFYNFILKYKVFIEKLNAYFSHAWTTLQDIVQNVSNNEIVIDCEYYYYVEYPYFEKFNSALGNFVNIK